jgi:hypothetical protein
VFKITQKKKFKTKEENGRVLFETGRRRHPGSHRRTERADVKSSGGETETRRKSRRENAKDEEKVEDSATTTKQKRRSKIKRRREEKSGGCGGRLELLEKKIRRRSRSRKRE